MPSLIASIAIEKPEVAQPLRKVSFVFALIRSLCPALALVQLGDSAMKTPVLFAAFLGLSTLAPLSLSAAQAPESQTTSESQAATAAAATADEKLDIARITHGLVLKDMGEAPWLSFVAATRQRFEDWSRDYGNSNNMKHFLDDKLLQLAPSVKSGKGSNLREFCKWMALYDAFNEPLPHFIADISEKDKRWIVQELSDFNWDRAARRIQEKSHA